MATEVWLGFFSLVGIFITAFFQFRTAKLIYQTKKTTEEKLEEIKTSTNGHLSRILETQEGMRTQLQQAGIVPAPTILKGATDDPADNKVIDSDALPPESPGRIIS